MSSSSATDTGKNSESALLSSIGEIMTSVVFTFAPFLVISIQVTASAASAGSPAYLDRVFQFFSSGEMALPIFSVIGSLAAAIALNYRRFPKWALLVPTIVSTLIVLFTGYVLGQTNGFDAPLLTSINRTLVVLYLGLVIMWWVYVFITMRDTDEIPSSDKRVDKLVQDLAAKRAAKNASGPK
tara:strand:+ start:1940 stop:2488 length:549 start_codon:yes stop_codon:yes gene_type:complete